MPGIATKFTHECNEAISFSREEALRLSNDFIGQSHILLGIIKHSNNVAMTVLANLSVDINSLKNNLENLYEKSHGFVRDNLNSLALTNEAERSIYLSVLEARGTVPFGADIIHLVLAIVKTADASINKILVENKINYELVKAKFEEITFNDKNSEFINDKEDEKILTNYNEIKVLIEHNKRLLKNEIDNNFRK